MEYYSAFKNKDILSFGDKWMELENIMLSEVTQTQKEIHGMYSLLAKKYRIPRIQFTELKKVRKPEGPSEDSSILLEREKKAITSGEGGRELGGKMGRVWGVGSGEKRGT